MTLAAITTVYWSLRYDPIVTNFLVRFYFIELINIKVATEVAITKTATNYSNYICKIDI